MMQYLPAKRVLALVAGLAVAALGSAYAQDTTETGQATIDTAAPTGAIDTTEVDTSTTRDTTDTSGVQNPPGYRGMERDTTIFPDSGSADTTSALQDTTGADTTGADTTGADTTGADTTLPGDTETIAPDAATPRIDSTENPAGGDTASQTPDSTQ
jgi:hypothetical protein